MNTEKQPRFSLECVAAAFFDIVMLSQKQSCKLVMCDHCVMHVQKALAAIPGVQEVIVSLENKSAKVILDPIVADETLKTAIEEAGYVLNRIL